MERQRNEDQEYREYREYRRRQAVRKRKQKQKLRRRKLRRLFFRAAAVIFAAALLPFVIRYIGSAFRAGNGPAGGSGSFGSAGIETVSANQVSALVQGQADPQLLSELQEMYRGNEAAADIVSHPENYPDALLALLVKRPETLDFVRNYPEKKNQKVQVDLQQEVTEGVVPLLYQWDERWGYDSYGSSIVGLAGCGPTCLSMVALGLTGDLSLHPGAVAAFSEEHGYYVSDSGTSWDLMTLGAEALGLVSTELPLDESRMVQALQDGRPIICSMRPGDFTDTGHFIVLTGYENGEFTVHDPNSTDNSHQGWSYDQIKGQIKNLWAFSK